MKCEAHGAPVEHVLVDQEGMDELRQRTVQSPGGREMGFMTVSAIAGVPVYVDECPCEETA